MQTNKQTNKSFNTRYSKEKSIIYKKIIQHLNNDCYPISHRKPQLLIIANVLTLEERNTW